MKKMLAKNSQQRKVVGILYVEKAKTFND